jgi:hypothetical protein
MRRRDLFLLLMIVVCLLFESGDLYAQSTDVGDHKFEIAGHFTLLTNSIVTEVNDLSVQCVNTPCPPPNIVLSKNRKTQPGFGGRIGYNLNANVAVEAELNIFPGADSFSEPEEFKDGYFLEGLFGVKVGKRFQKVGIFGKARPGFLYASKGDLEPRPGVGCIAIFPPPVGCFQTTSQNSFALDVGGVVEVYPTARTVVRFDFGDTIVRLSERNVSATFNRGVSIPRLAVWRIPAETTHNFQGSIGMGFRF